LDKHLMPRERRLRATSADPQDVEAARLKLANALLSVAHEDTRVVDVLKRAALQRMALDFRVGEVGGLMGVSGTLVAAAHTVSVISEARTKAAASTLRRVPAHK
jgi:hypothetical protein